MNRSSAVAAVALLVALFAVLTALFAVFRPNVGTGAERTVENARLTAAREGQLLQHMVLFQRYAEKLALAVDAGNAPLATFYAQEIEGNAERLVDGGYVVDGIDVSAIAAEVALPRAARLTDAAESGDRARVDAAFAQMLDGCNACHKRSGRRWIVVGVPPACVSAHPSLSFAPVR